MKIIHFHNGSGGGVLSVVKNLVQYSKNTEIENHIVFTINESQRTNFHAPDLRGATQASVFYYAPNWNFYYTCKELAKHIPDQNCIIAAHDWMELGAATMLGLQNSVIQFVHGDYDYYYQLAAKHASSINGFVCVSSAISNKLKQLLPDRVNDIACLELPVPEVPTAVKEKTGRRIVFIGRCEKEKGYHLLPLIDEQLRKSDLEVEWHIYGEGSLDSKSQSIWSGKSKVFFHGVLPSEELLKRLPQYDYLVLPTIAEGMPVTVIEAMKAGLVPVVNHLPGGLEELIGTNERGYLIKENEIDGYVTVLQLLIQNRKLAFDIASKASLFANEKFDPVRSTARIETFMIDHSKKRNLKKPRKIYGSRLDQKWLPNRIVKIIRDCNQK